jgi:dihydroorotate dehydrogenase (NAD+) catalytic subunit
VSAGRLDLSVDLCGVRLRNPLVLASGIWGTGAALMERVARCGAGAVTAKSIGPEYRKGHRNPTVLDWGHGLINAVGLANPGVDEAVPILRETAERLHTHGVAFIASIFAHCVDDFGRMAARVSEARPDLIEVNVSCPNVSAEFGPSFALDPAAAAAATSAVKAATSIPVFVKLSPNVTSIVEIARAVAAAGADGLTLINTVGPGMLIDVDSGCPVLSNREGGLSGPAIRPIAVRCVYDVSRALPGIPIVGTGGVASGRDAVEMIMAGATAVGLGSALYRRGPEVFCQVGDEFAAFMAERGYEGLAGMRGIAHGK